MIRKLRGIFAIGFLIGPLHAADSTYTKQIPIESFADRPFLDGPVLSPDGTTIVSRATNKGKVQLVISRVDGPVTTNKVLNLGDATISSIMWAGNRRVLLTVSLDATVFNTRTQVARLFVVDVGTGTSKLLDAASKGIVGGNILYADPGGDWALVSSQNSIYDYPSVKRIDLTSGAVIKVEGERTGVWNWYADQNGVVRAGIAYGDDRWTMWYRATPGEPLRKVRGKRDQDSDGAVDSVRFQTDTNNGVIITNARTGRFAAYKYDFVSGAIGDAIYENPQVDITGVMVDPTSGKIAGVAYTDDRYRVNWLDPEMRVVQSKLDKALPEAENIVQSRSADGNRMLVWSGSASDPGTFYVYDRLKKQLRPFVQPMEKLAEVELASVKPISFKARDGLDIPGYLTLPRGLKPVGLPLIVMPHGGPYVRDTWDYDPFVQFLASRGYAVLQPNFRGSTGYGKFYVEKGYGQWGRAMQDDIDDGVDWLIASGQVDAKRVCIMGISYGGYAALWGAIRNPERYRCAISLAGVTDLPDMLRYDRKSFSAPRYFREWEKKVKGEEKVDLVSVSPLAQAARLNIPVLIAHGEKDDNVPPRQGHKMVTALAKRGAQVESVFYPDAKHGLQSSEDIIDFLKRLETFLSKNNPA